MQKGDDGVADPDVGRHYTEKREVVADRIDNEYIYPSDVISGGDGPSTATVRAYVQSERHYKVYRLRVGDPDYEVFLYHEYKTTWKGQWRYEGSSTWFDEPDLPLRTQTTRERSPILDMLLGTLPINSEELTLEEQ